MKILLLFRLARVAVHVTAGLITCGMVFPWLSQPRRDGHVRRWSRQLLGICNVRVEQEHGALTLAHAMVVANHVSWLDIFVINALHPCRFVAKSEIRDWPVLGWLAERAGTVFIERNARRELRQLFKNLVTRLSAGERVAFFPEGTTGGQGGLLAFHANLFEAAVDAAAPVQPYAVVYTDQAGALHPAVDFLGDMTFAASLVQILSGPPVRARLMCLEPLKGGSRRELAQRAHDAVGQALRPFSGRPHAPDIQDSQPDAGCGLPGTPH